MVPISWECQGLGMKSGAYPDSRICCPRPPEDKITGMRGQCACTRFASPIPLRPPGIWMSDRMRSAPPEVSHNQSQASSPVSAVTTSKPSVSKISWIKLRMSQSSSTTNTVDNTVLCPCWFVVKLDWGTACGFPLPIKPSLGSLCTVMSL